MRASVAVGLQPPAMAAYDYQSRRRSRAQWIASAPLYIIVLGDPAEGWVRSFDNHSHIDVDCAIITEHLCLAAAEQGLGTCWVCNFDPAKLHEGLGLPEGLVPVVILPLGYPAEGSFIPEKKRKSPDEILLKR